MIAERAWIATRARAQMQTAGTSPAVVTRTTRSAQRDERFLFAKSQFTSAHHDSMYFARSLRRSM